MTAAHFVSLVNDIIFVVIFVVVLARAIRLRTLPSYEIAAFFGLIVVTLLAGDLLDWLGLAGAPLATKLAFITVPLLPYLLIRIVDHFTPQLAWLPWGAAVASLAVILVGLASPEPVPVLVLLLVVGWVVAGGGYASLVFVRESSSAIGVTSRRITAAAIGSGLLALALLVFLAGALVPEAPSRPA